MQFVLKPIEGRMVPNPRVPGRIFGHEAYRDKDDTEYSMLTNRNEPVRKWKFDGAEFEAADTNDGFFRKAIMQGDLEYVATMSGGKRMLDHELLRASMKHRKARAEQAIAAQLAQEAEALRLAKEVEAAAEGLTLEEFEASKKGDH